MYSTGCVLIHASFNLVQCHHNRNLKTCFFTGSGSDLKLLLTASFVLRHFYFTEQISIFYDVYCHVGLLILM